MLHMHYVNKVSYNKTITAVLVNAMLKQTAKYISLSNDGQIIAHVLTSKTAMIVKFQLYIIRDRSDFWKEMSTL